MYPHTQARVPRPHLLGGHEVDAEIRRLSFLQSRGLLFLWRDKVIVRVDGGLLPRECRRVRVRDARGSSKQGLCLCEHMRYNPALPVLTNQICCVECGQFPIDVHRQYDHLESRIRLESLRACACSDAHPSNVCVRVWM